MPNTITNADRAELAAAALRHFERTTGTDHEDALCDLLCDLIHWASVNNFDFDVALCRARGHYQAEFAETVVLPDFIAIKWVIEDVQEIRPDLAEAQCREVLATVRDRHDATIGVTWDVLSIVANDLYPAA
jgi:hypothetical protein